MLLGYFCIIFTRQCQNKKCSGKWGGGRGESYKQKSDFDS